MNHKSKAKRDFEWILDIDGKTKLYKYNGRNISISQLSLEIGLSKSTIQTRISRYRREIYDYKNFEELINTAPVKIERMHTLDEMLIIANKAIRPLEAA